jgi:hypothetical protein
MRVYYNDTELAFWTPWNNDTELLCEALGFDWGYYEFQHPKMKDKKLSNIYQVSESYKSDTKHVRIWSNG